MLIFILLQKTCACGKDGDRKVIVQFYEELENGILDPYCKPPLKTPLCLGALISQKHVLTVKSCFGAKPNEESINKVKLNRFESCESCLTSLTGSYLALLSLTGHYSALLSLTGP